MRHVDEGTIHAWLDEQITDPVEAAWIEEHVRGCAECSARLAGARATFDRAQALLAATAPVAERPSFESLEAKAGHNVPSSDTPAARWAHLRGQRLLDRYAAPNEDSVPVTHQSGPHSGPRRAERAKRYWQPAMGSARYQGRNPWLVQAGWAASIVLAVGLGWTARELTDRDALRLDPAPAMAEQSAAITPDPPDRAEAARPMAGPATGVDVSAPLARPRASRQTADATPRPTEPAAQPESAAPAPDTDRPAPAPPATTQVPAPTAPVPVTTRPQETIVTTGEPASAVAQVSTEWRLLPRTEAAARTGMPLYGIDGLEPALTALSESGTLVRTVYRLPSGEAVELVQQRVAPELAQSGERPIVETTTRSLAAQGRAGRVASQITPVRRTWSSVRGDVRVTLRTTSDAADLDALALKLRVD